MKITPINKNCFGAYVPGRSDSKHPDPAVGSGARPDSRYQPNGTKNAQTKPGIGYIELYGKHTSPRLRGGGDNNPEDVEMAASASTSEGDSVATKSKRGPSSSGGNPKKVPDAEPVYRFNTLFG